MPAAFHLLGHHDQAVTGAGGNYAGFQTLRELFLQNLRKQRVFVVYAELFLL